MPALNRIKLKGFKSVLKADLKLKNLNILIGANGSGKSNFISLFELLNQIIQNNMGIFIPKSGGPDHFLHYGQKNTPEISIYLHFDLNTSGRCDKGIADCIGFINNMNYEEGAMLLKD